jgi:hypothetical protein
MLRRTGGCAIISFIGGGGASGMGSAGMGLLQFQARIGFGWRIRKMPFRRPDRKDESHGRRHNHQNDFIEQAYQWIQRIGV